MDLHGIQHESWAGYLLPFLFDYIVYAGKVVFVTLWLFSHYSVLSAFDSLMDCCRLFISTFIYCTDF